MVADGDRHRLLPHRRLLVGVLFLVLHAERFLELPLRATVDELAEEAAVELAALTVALVGSLALSVLRTVLTECPGLRWRERHAEFFDALEIGFDGRLGLLDVDAVFVGHDLRWRRESEREVDRVVNLPLLARALDLDVAAQDYNMAQTGLGAKIGYPIDFNSKFGKLTPEAKFKWLYDWVGDAQQATSTFTGGGGSFNTQGFTPAQSSYDFGVKLTLETKKVSS